MSTLHEDLSDVIDLFICLNDINKKTGDKVSIEKIGGDILMLYCKCCIVNAVLVLVQKKL